MLPNVENQLPHRFRTAPRPVKIIEHARIPLSDGVELAARVWIPGDLAESSVPAVLEYIPYRKNDMTAGRDQTIHPEFARAGYASVRVDLRGAGDSTGIMTDEYSATELDDGLQVLRWIAAQPWCNGKVGIIGKSWGGFNGLQIAALQPPELAAIITVCSTDDRYADDVHYNGGAIVGDQMLSWAATMWAYNARPQDPSVVGAGWEDDWKRRIDEAPVNIEEWLGHQRRDDYWKHGSVCETPDAITVPVLAVGGLLDEYRTTLFRLMESAAERRAAGHEPAPVHALLGPWAHNYPHQAAPGPGIDFIAESIRWWDQWLSGVDNGVREQPQLRAYVPESAPVGSDHEVRPGRWVSEQHWPAPSVTERRLDATAAVQAGPATTSSAALVGFAGGSWLQFGAAAGVAGDQAADDARSYTLDWEQPNGLELLGTPSVRVRVAADRDRGAIAIRLADVAPDGSSRLLTVGLANLTHHTGHETPTPLTPGEEVTLDVPLLATAHRLAPGHRLRLSISASFWPNLWPAPEETLVTIVALPELTVPVRAAGDSAAEQRAATELAADLGDPPAPAHNTVEAGGPPMTRELTADLVTGATSLSTFVEDWQTDHATGLFYYTAERDSYHRTAGDALSARAVCERTIRYRRPALDVGAGPAGLAELASAGALPATDLGWDVELRTRSTMSGDLHSFVVTNELDAYRDGVKFHSRTTSASIPRDLT
ncbi:CocE/NonD family hydrolase [Leucobacter luti]|uniref:Xaa-Pro dipeptidyl-peptidase C-terminal domain-containing protein n=1 Tax=Leucobacter luti TaxID=340320 RepID=A0A4Q7TL42_9MICO|nr:CocE/NonD family hydrolase [Leucobacter luti]MBL3700194.1 CocE/NonD family hydrolase [Leucobacter luti]RZT61083.1 hypothetical protein EV139_2832 [Leucobacter luti]